MAYLPVSDMVVSLQPFNPKAFVEAASVNILTERDGRDVTRKGLDAARMSAELALAASSKASLLAYTTNIQAHNQDMFVTGFTKPSIIEQTSTQIMPSLSIGSISVDSITGEVSALAGAGDILSGTGLSTDMLSGAGIPTDMLGGAGLPTDMLSGGGIPTGIPDNLTVEGLGGSLQDTAMGVLENEQIRDLAIDAAGYYVCGLTGGVVPPSVCSAVIEGGVTYLETGELDTGAIVKDAVLGEIGGGAFEGITDQYFDMAADQLLSDPNLSGDFLDNPSSFLEDTVGHVTDFAGDVNGPIGGINTITDSANGLDTSALTSGVATNIVEKATEAGDPSIFSKAMDYVSGNPEKFTDQVITLGSKMMQNPANMNTYVDLVGKSGINVNDYLTAGSDFGCSAVTDLAHSSLVGSGLMTDEQFSGMTTKLSDAVASDKFTKLTNMGDKIAREYMPRDDYKQMTAITDMTKLVTTGGVQNPVSANKQLIRSAERVFNNGKSFNEYSRNIPGYEHHSTITQYTRSAKDLIF